MAKRFIEKALKDHPSMSCRIRIYEDGTIELVSYTTMVLRAVRRDPDTREYWVEAHGTFWDNERVFTPPHYGKTSFVFPQRVFPRPVVLYVQVCGRKDWRSS